MITQRIRNRARLDACVFCKSFFEDRCVLYPPRSGSRKWRHARRRHIVRVAPGVRQVRRLPTSGFVVPPSIAFQRGEQINTRLLLLGVEVPQGPSGSATCTRPQFIALFPKVAQEGAGDLLRFQDGWASDAAGPSCIKRGWGAAETSPQFRRPQRAGQFQKGRRSALDEVSRSSSTRSDATVDSKPADVTSDVLIVAGGLARYSAAPKHPQRTAGQDCRFAKKGVCWCGQGPGLRRCFPGFPVWQAFGVARKHGISYANQSPISFPRRRGI